jgi:hypothetical protein
MARTLYVAPVPPLNVTAGAAYNTSVTLTDVSPAPQIVLPANLLDVGQALRLRAFGTFSNTSTPTLLLGFYYGGVSGTALAATSAITTTVSAVNWQWSMEYEGRVRSTGTAGTILGAGWIDLATSLTAVTHRPIPETALATVTIDTTTAKPITVGAQWGTSNASNTLTCHHFSVELIG